MSRRQSAARLQFDGELAASMRRINRPRRSLAPRLAFVACLTVVIGFALSGTDYVPWHLWPGSSNAAVARTCDALVEALRTESIAQLEPVLADGEAGKAVLAAHNQRLMESGSGVHAAAISEEAPAGISCHDFLSSARRQLAEQGVAWGQITPVAFGGIEASVIDTALMSTPATSITGDLYFRAGTDIYALEFTARKCEDDVVITGFWRCQRVDVPADALKQYARDRYAEEMAVSPNDEGLSISEVRHLFVPLPTKA